MVVSGSPKRSFFFLQGLATPFFSALASEIQRRGHSVVRVNLCGGDKLFWRVGSSVDFCGREEDWPDFLGRLVAQHGVTDVLLFGDCRPYHQAAIKVAKSRGLAVHVFEEGYLRPNWITVEREGTNAFSSIPRDPKVILREADRLEEADHETSVQLRGAFARRVRWETIYQLTTLALRPRFPGFVRHRPHHPLAELAGWVRRLAKRPMERAYSEDVSTYLVEGKERFFLFPLQLQSDYQIRRHSPFRDLREVKELVVESFARKASPGAKLLLKVHPLDNGLVNHRKRLNEIAGRHGVLDRVFIIDGGHLPTLFTACRGVVVVNSTTGMSAMHYQRPVKVLGKAIFDVPGLAFQGSLDRFWTDASPPDEKLYRAFRKLVISRSQVLGSFFSKEGIPVAVDGVIERLGIPVVEGAVPAVQIFDSPEPALRSVPGRQAKASAV
jgi:capsular polysaccharide export protein